MQLGTYAIDDALTWTVTLHDPATGAPADGDSAPTYRLYEQETGTPIMTGSMAKLDDSNTVGFYSEQITISTANGFDEGKCYTILVNAVVDDVEGNKGFHFSVAAMPEPDDLAASVLKLDWDGMTGEPLHSVLNALRFILNKWDTADGYVTVMKEDGTTAAYKKGITSDAGAEPVVSVGEPETP